jgi:hypothetical protein
MKAKSFLLRFIFFTQLTFSMIPASWGTTVTFDDLSETGSGAFFSSPYQGLTWSSIFCNNAILYTNVLPNALPGVPTNGLSGDYYGMVSDSNVAGVLTGSEIDSPTDFNFLSAYMTAYWNSNLNIEVQGFNGTTLVYDTTVVASATSPTLFTFDYQNINRLYFTSSGGQPAFGIDYGGIFVMDNFTFEFVPEPSSLLLATTAALLLCPLLKRRRAL